MLDPVGQALQVNCGRGCLGQVGAAESHLRAGRDQWATWASEVEGWDPRPVTKNVARLEVGLGRLFQHHPLVSLPLVLLPPFSHSPFARVIFQNCSPNVLSPFTKSLG